MKRPLVAALAAVFGVVGCSTASKDIAAIYVSPHQYQNYDCDQIAAEATRIQARVDQLGGRLDEAASNDKAITAVGVILFWPALFFLGGTKQQEAEYARLRGEYDALQQVAVQKHCQGAVPGDTPTQTASQPAGEQPATIPPVALEPAAPAQ